MIYALEGTLTELLEDRAIVSAYGISYEVWIPESALHPLLTQINKSIKFYTHHQIREDAHLLYGFLKKEEKTIFECLITVNGVGPKVGLKLLSGLTVSQLIQSVIQEDIHTLIQAPGVGKKMAERLIVELKDKLQKLTLSLPDLSTIPQVPHIPITDDLQLALKSLGYSYDEIKRALQKAGSLVSDSETLETNLKAILKHL